MRIEGTEGTDGKAEGERVARGNRKAVGGGVEVQGFKRSRYLSIEPVPVLVSDCLPVCLIYAYVCRCLSTHIHTRSYSSINQWYYGLANSTPFGQSTLMTGAGREERR